MNECTHRPLPSHMSQSGHLTGSAAASSAAGSSDILRPTEVVMLILGGAGENPDAATTRATSATSLIIIIVMVKLYSCFLVLCFALCRWHSLALPIMSAARFWCQFFVGESPHNRAGLLMGSGLTSTWNLRGTFLVPFTGPYLLYVLALYILAARGSVL